jgi:1-acyl-sn-glycerol-3-phosphate acyltransferase
MGDARCRHGNWPRENHSAQLGGYADENSRKQVRRFVAENWKVGPIRNGECDCGREPLIEAISAFLAHYKVRDISEIVPALERIIDEAGTEAIEFLGQRLALAGMEWGYYVRDPLVRRMHHIFADHFLQKVPVLSGTEHLIGVADKPVVIFTNHVSYSDAHVLDYLLHKVDAGRLSDRLTVVAGPKAYTHIARRFSSLCFGTIKTPQSTALATEEAVMSLREVARAARRSLQAAQERLRLGEALLVFAEGTRSRSGQMQQLLSGAARYLQSPNIWVLPIGITGTEKLFPIGEDSLNSVPVTLRIGRPIAASVLDECAQGDRRMLMDCVGFGIGELLPREYRGFYGEDERPDAQARRLSRAVFR